jgi:hypothetical protein
VPFSRLISRDEGSPWGSTGLSTRSWLLIPVRDVLIGDLVATQDGIYLEPLIRERDSSWCGDPWPHVVAWRGHLYLEDGHHRVIRAALAGRIRVEARVFSVP